MNRNTRVTPHRIGLACIAGALAGLAGNASAAMSGPPIAIGQTGAVSPEPYVSVPPVTPCVVQLYSAGSATGTFDDYSNHAFNYVPPNACPGPWSKVVFKADFNVSNGTQFDRTAAVWVGGLNLYFGTTQEPGSNVSPSWHVERDVTDLASVLQSPQPGTAAVYNIYNSTYNGSITGSAELDFYPASSAYPAASSPDQALGLVNDPAGTYAYVTTDGKPLTRTFTLPRNIERAYLDITAQPQAGDEFWYTCGPDAYASVAGCGGTAFREVEVSIDGRRAGIAPVSGWVFTGGIDPFLWRPIPGVQTLNFVPFRVDLTPFVAMLDDGNPHTVGVGVVNGDPSFANNNQYFATAANLLLYLDHGSRQVTGALRQVVDSGANPSVTTNVSPDQTQFAFGVTSQHSLAAYGYANTSHGVVNSVARQTLNFGNNQNIVNTSALYNQTIRQTSTALSISYAYGPTITTPTNEARYWSFPLNLQINYAVAADGSAKQTTSALQGYTHTTQHNGADGSLSRSRTQRGTTTDTLNFDSSGNFIGNTGQAGTQSYMYNDSTGACYSRSVSAVSGAVTAVADGSGCKGQ
ncbi:MAG: peptide-N(4)-(N-acetyl-beta-glucosaminyl)asparagine amidase [Proteobacteria bacterium]|nr:peptide-N(4)-(N-acetyl-beta-glucosaminyl)asparagine amidase [Pseudomonadota bacterium]